MTVNEAREFLKDAHQTHYVHPPQIYDTDDAIERAWARQQASRCNKDCKACELIRLVAARKDGA